MTLAMEESMMLRSSRMETTLEPSMLRMLTVTRLCAKALTHKIFRTRLRSRLHRDLLTRGTLQERIKLPKRDRDRGTMLRDRPPRTEKSSSEESMNRDKERRRRPKDALPSLRKSRSVVRLSSKKRQSAAKRKRNEGLLKI